MQFSEGAVWTTEDAGRSVVREAGLGFVESQKAAIDARLTHEQRAFQHLEDFEAYISRRANSLKLTLARPVKVENPELELDALLKRLVAERSPALERAAGVTAELSEVFREARVDGLLK